MAGGAVVAGGAIVAWRGARGGLVGMGQAAQHGQPAADRVGARRQSLVRKRLPRGVDRHLLGRQQRAHRGGKVVGLTAGGGDGQHRPAGTPALGGRGDQGHHERPQGGWRGEVEPTRLRPAGASQVAGAGQRRVAEDGRQQTGELHGSHSP
jgi:hypothetical protein